ncbi:MAG: hypothetical protein ACREMY_14750 [bacterium]
MTITVYGASDDLIEVDGDISEEFYAIDSDEGDLLAFSDGTVLKIAYSTSGVWRITPVVTIGHVSITQAPEDDEDNYSDRATLTGPVKWVVHGKKIGRARGEVERLRTGRA